MWSAICADFLFRPEQARTPIRALSGGERNRLLLARQLARPCNLLVLDEPTNDLDMDTLDLLQEVLAEFAGTLLLVSHDRDFLDRLVTSVIAFEGGGRWQEYAGGYSDHLRQRPPEVSPPASARAAARPRAGPGRLRLESRRQRDLTRVIAEIEAIEAEIGALERELADPDLFRRDPADFQRRTGRLAELQSDLDVAERRWLALEEQPGRGRLLRPAGLVPVTDCQLLTPAGRPARVALVHEWLDTYYGSERVVAEILACFPDADLFTLVDFMAAEQRGFLGGREVRTSFLQRLPFARRRFRAYLPLMPLAIEQFDLQDYDLVLSSSHAFAKGVLTGPGQLHVAYIHAPMRYAWEYQHQYLRQSGLERGLRGALARWVLHYLRLWDCPDRKPGRPLHRQLEVHRASDRQDLSAVERGRLSAGRRRALRAPGRQGGLLPRGLALRALQAHRDDHRGVPVAGRAAAGRDRRRSRDGARAGAGGPERDHARLSERRESASPHAAPPRR